MVVSTSLIWIPLLQSHILHYSLVFIIPFYFFVILIPSANSLTFNIPNIGPDNLNNEIKVENGAFISPDQGLQMNADMLFMAGRARYPEPLHLWDKASGQLADFNTSFSFIIDSSGNPNYADGLAFFLAQDNSVITYGYALGLPINYTTLEATAPFVTVEFDSIWHSGWDPENSSVGEHVGININSLRSVNYEKWWTNITYGKENQAWITYNSTSKNLSVVFTGYINNTRVLQNDFHYIIDLREYLPERVIFGFTAATGSLVEKHIVKSWNFSSTNLQVDENKEPTGSPVEAPIPRKKKIKIALVVGLSVGLCGLIGGLALVGFCLWKRRDKEDNGGIDVYMDNDFEMGSGPKKFSYKELARATNNFGEEEKLGEGGFGGVYRGFLKELSSYVAVKRVSRSSKQGIKEYASEVKIIGRLRHRNMVQLIGWCHEKMELLLVYELMENGSLDSHLFKGKSLLPWGVRYKIAQGLASALLYLHEEWEQCVVHRDIKSSNIMLDSNFNAKLGDFGLARLVDHEKGSHTTLLAGTMGYMAPECVITGKANKESDVFSFGVVALEISCGRKPIGFSADESQTTLVEWVWDLYGMGKLLDAADAKLSGDFDQQEMENLMIVGLWCAHPDSNLRPSIKQAIQVLNFDAPLPILPPKMPVATYFTPLVNMPTSSLTACSATASDNSQIQSSSYSHNTNSSKYTTSSGASSPSASLLYAR